LILNNIGKLEEAELSTLKAININLDDTNAHSNIRFILLEKGE